MTIDYTVLFIAGFLLLCAILLSFDTVFKFNRLKKIEEYSRKYRLLIAELKEMRHIMNTPTTNNDFSFLFHKFKYLGGTIESREELVAKMRREDLADFCNNEDIEFNVILKEINRYYNNCEYIISPKGAKND